MNTPVTRSRLCQALLGLMLLSTAPLPAASFVYEGQLNDRGVPANGRYDIQLAVYRDAELGATVSAPIVFTAVDVIAGRFRLDFDAEVDDSKAAWVQLAVRDAGAGSFSSLPGRTKATQAPAAIGACWSTVGDSGSNPAVNFLGTTDAQPLVLRSGNTQSLRLEPSAVLSAGLPNTANVIAGSSVNSAAAGVRGATISGGGAPSDPDLIGGSNPNQVKDHYGSIGGGARNQVGDGAGTLYDASLATVAGGGYNTASAYASTVAGGEYNTASGVRSGIGGGENNLASGRNSSVLGGETSTASGESAAVGGGIQNCAGGLRSFAIGAAAKVRPGINSGAAGVGCSNVTPTGDLDGDAGTFVWADNQGLPLTSTGDNQFLLRAGGGVGINGTPPANSANELNLFGSAGFGGYSNLFMRQLESDRGGILISAGESSSNTNNAGFYIDQFKPDGVNTGQVRRLELDTSGRLRIYVDNPIKPTAGSWSAPSDARLKHHVAPLQGSLERLLALRGVSYEYTIDAPSAYFTPGTHAGFIAQEVQQVFPNWVSADANGYLMLGPQGFEALAVEALRDLRDEGTLIDSAQAAEIRSLALRNQALENEAAALRASDAAIRQELAELRTLIETQHTGDR